MADNEGHLRQKVKCSLLALVPSFITTYVMPFAIDVDVLRVDAVMTVSSGQELIEDSGQASPTPVMSEGVLGLRSSMGTADTTSLTENCLRMYPHEDGGSSLRPVSSCKCSTLREVAGKNNCQGRKLV